MADTAFRQRVRARETVFGFMTNLDSVDLVEILCGLDIDFTIIDLEHGALDFGILKQMLRICRSADIAGLVRVPDIDNSLASRVLDIGADGLVFPRVEDDARLRAAIAATRYSPDGTRGLHTWTSAASWGITPADDHIRQQHDGITIIGQIETTAGVDNVESIVEVHGLDVLLLGPNDLAQSYSTRGTHEMERAVDHVVRVAKEAHLPFGSGGNAPAQLDELVHTGASLLLADLAPIIAGSLTGLVDEVRRALPSRPAKSSW